MTPDIQSQWWRWPLVPIASISGAILVSAVIFAVFRLATILNRFDPDAAWPQFVENMIIASSLAYFCSLIAYTVAPKHKLHSAIAMLAVFVGSAAILIFYVISQDVFPNFYVIQLVICFLIATALSVFTTLGKHRTYELEKQL